MNYRKGFTLIEILIVVAIIGVLTAGIVANVSNARNKSADGAAKAILAQYKTEVDLYANGRTSNYANACDVFGVFVPSRLLSLQTELIATTNNRGCYVNTEENQGAYAYAIRYKSNPVLGYCIDSTGESKELNATQVSSFFKDSFTACPQ